MWRGVIIFKPSAFLPRKCTYWQNGCGIWTRRRLKLVKPGGEITCLKSVQYSLKNNRIPIKIESNRIRKKGVRDSRWVIYPSVEPSFCSYWVFSTLLQFEDDLGSKTLLSSEIFNIFFYFSGKICFFWNKTVLMNWFESNCPAQNDKRGVICPN